jgi:exopolyphosphatase / guanosine-5'-triphosphate,3'-diphosphate pyrophosphatase
VETILRAACIDIGSNTTRLLVADIDGGRLHVVRQERVFTALARGLGPAGRIGERTLDELTQIVADQLVTARRLGATELRAVATAAVRLAADGPGLVRCVAERIGTPIEILSPGEEARLAFAGAVGMLEQAPSGLVGVVDVGGGSSEMAVGEAGGPVSWWESVALGTSSLTERWLPSDPPRPSELDDALAQVRAAVAGASPPTPRLTLAVGGSATSLARVTGTLLDGPAFARALDLLGAEPAATLGARLGVDPRRVRLLPAALVLLQAIAARLGAPLAIGSGGIREGLLLETASR